MRPGGYSLAPGEEWTDRAATWPVMIVSRETSPDHMFVTHQHLEREGRPVNAVHLACARCPGLPSVFCLSPNTEGPGYTVMAADMLAGILAHIRRSHEA